MANKAENKKLSRLGYSITGKRGGAPRIKDDIGSACIFVDYQNLCDSSKVNSIKFDAFDGVGEGYGRMCSCKIKIKRLGSTIFEGSFDDLVSKIEDKC